MKKSNAIESSTHDMIVVHSFTADDAQKLGVTTTAQAALIGELALEHARASFSLYKDNMVAGERDVKLTLKFASLVAKSSLLVDTILEAVYKALVTGKCVPLVSKVAKKFYTICSSLVDS